MRKQGKNESNRQYNERLYDISIIAKNFGISYGNVINNNRKIFDSSSVEEYKQVLEENCIDYVEGEYEKETGGTVHWVFPQSQFRKMTRGDINKLFKGMAQNRKG